MTLQIETATELVDREMEARWTTRRVARETQTLQAINASVRRAPRPDPR